MTVFIPDSRIEQFIAEDIPYIDLTTEVLGIGKTQGSIEYFTREDCVLCGVEEAARVLERVGARIETMCHSGDVLKANDVWLRATGNAEALHMGWKVALSLVDHCSAVATKTRGIVESVHAANPACEVLTTRKSMPGVKDLLVKAVMTGGAFPHRLGLSETVLVFAHHITFMGGFDAFVAKLPELRHKCVEKKLFVEADAKEARTLAKAGVDGIQLDKVPVDELAPLAKELRSMNPHLTLIAAGGINAQNAAAYAACGVDGLATTACFTAKPLDMSVRMSCSECS